MRTAVDDTFPLLTLLVAQAEQRSGSKMNAYSDVARVIGESGSWVRKFLGRQPVRLDADTYLNIQAEYSRACKRWDEEAALQRARFFALQGETNAMAKLSAERMDVDAGGSSRGSRTAPALVAPSVGGAQK